MLNVQQALESYYVYVGNGHYPASFSPIDVVVSDFLSSYIQPITIPSSIRSRQYFGNGTTNYRCGDVLEPDYFIWFEATTKGAFVFPSPFQKLYFSNTAQGVYCLSSKH